MCPLTSHTSHWAAILGCWCPLFYQHWFSITLPWPKITQIHIQTYWQWIGERKSAAIWVIASRRRFTAQWIVCFTLQLIICANSYKSATTSQVHSHFPWISVTGGHPDVHCTNIHWISFQTSNRRSLHQYSLDIIPNIQRQSCLCCSQTDVKYVSFATEPQLWHLFQALDPQNCPQNNL